MADVCRQIVVNLRTFRVLVIILLPQSGALGLVSVNS